ncbi:N-6 DNA methylase [Sphingopyxis sp.]|uniref:N-6 DNA methylase n=1 Tax=Sphingopyxis sp. TaxID=1908224 RepID=UPI0025FBDC6D|nr:N-6 DNA methylase [Sphingopyxis sp.]
MTERLGIVYTPVEVVDFIIHSVNEVLQSEFRQTLGSKGVHIIDPFTGTGTFITRLLQSGLIQPDELAHKYAHEIHANEIVLLAYYIAAINIEAVYHSLSGGDYQPFGGICLTDTFQLYEQEKDMLAELMPDNSHRRARQKELDIRVIMGNPPYSVGQRSENDNADNIEYPRLDGRIRETYAANVPTRPWQRACTTAISVRSAGPATGSAMRGWWPMFPMQVGWTPIQPMACANVWPTNLPASMFHLRGERTHVWRARAPRRRARCSAGSRTPVAIIAGQESRATTHGQIHFHDIGDYRTREDKLATVARFGSIGGITRTNDWQAITPDEHGDWLGQRDKAFDAYIPLGDKGDSSAVTLFSDYSRVS